MHSLPTRLPSLLRSKKTCAACTRRILAGSQAQQGQARPSKAVAGVVGLTFLDERIYRVRHETVIHPLLAPTVPLVVGLGRIPGLRRMKVPMKWLSRMYTLVNDKKLLSIFLKDRTSAGASVSLGFLSSFMSYRPDVEPENFAVCPVLLAQPEKDR